MKILPFTNAHSHIFTVNHAPDYFLKTAIKNTNLAIWLEAFLQKRQTKFVLGLVSKLFFWKSKEKRETIERYVQFVQIGTSATQQDIFEKVSSSYKQYGNYRIVVLSQVLDYLDLERSSNHKNIQTQVQEIVELKRHAAYRDHLAPFLGLDPRITGIDITRDWVKKFISKDYGFCGIKIYPAAGYFPFDARLDEIWKWAEENEIPIMTHCTRVGSFYLGKMESIINSGGINVTSLNPDSPSMVSIRKRIETVVADASIRDKNMIWCNIFGHPENYIPVLEKYPKLKICLAHLGGSNEVLYKYGMKNTRTNYPAYMNDNWYEHVLTLMKNYENVYSDISYTLSCKEALQKIADDFRNDWNTEAVESKKIFYKLLYGTDFYMTQQEEFGDEPGLQKLFAGAFSQTEALLLAFTNPDKYLSSKIWP